MKIKGAEFMEWYDRHFPKGYFWDSDEESIHDDDGNWKLDPNETYDTAELGEIYENDPIYEDDQPEVRGLTVDKAIRAWRKSRDFDLFSIEIPKARTDSVLLALAELGVKVRKC